MAQAVGGLHMPSRGALEGPPGSLLLPGAGLRARVDVVGSGHRCQLLLAHERILSAQRTAGGLFETHCCTLGLASLSLSLQQGNASEAA